MEGVPRFSPKLVGDDSRKDSFMPSEKNETPDLASDLARIQQQEDRLQFASFTPETAWELGNRMRALAVARHAPMAIEIEHGGQQLFFCALPGTTPANADWIRRKRNTVLRFYRSSYAIGLSLQAEQSSLEKKVGLPLRDYSTHGGCFPLLLRGTGCIGTITASGLPQREDHSLVVEALAAQLGVPLEEVAFSA
jgi:uncharacterized protein (UPF0303 family)